MKIKFINESLDDFLLEFERGQDPKAAMGIGAKTLWDEFREKKHWPTEEEVKEAGFTPETLYKIDRAYYRTAVATPKEAPIYLELFPNMDPEFLKELDKDTVKFMDGLKSGQGTSSDLSFPASRVYNGELDLIKEKLPKTWEWILKNAPAFIEVIENSNPWSGGAIAREFYEEYFDPMLFTPAEVLNNLSYPWIDSMREIFKKWPEFINKFRKTAGAMELIRAGAIEPQFLKDLIKAGHIPIRDDNNWNDESDLLLDYIATESDEVKDLAAQLLSNLYKDGKKVPKTFSKKILNKGGRHLPPESLTKYFPELFPASLPSEKMAERSSEKTKKDYEAAEDIIKNYPGIELTTTDRQYKNGSMQFSILNVPYKSHNWQTHKPINHTDGTIDYTIAKTGYLRKGKPGADRLAVVHFDPYETFTGLVNMALPKIDRDLKKLGR